MGYNTGHLCTRHSAMDMSPDSESPAPIPAPPTPGDTITRVKPGSGAEHCYFCDTPIAAGWPAVERMWYHTGGPYRRNNGATTGYCRAGILPECCHVQCAWRLDVNSKGRSVKCQGCGGEAEPGRRVVNYIARASERCSETSPLHWCFDCAAAFVSRHRELLDGHLGAEQSQQGVAWVRHRPLFSPAGLQAGCGLPPLTASAKAEYLSIFRAPSADAEARAVARHRELQAAILGAFEADAALSRARTAGRGAAGSRAEGTRLDTPVERKARRMRIDSGGSRRGSRADEAMACRSRSRSPLADI